MTSMRRYEFSHSPEVLQQRQRKYLKWFRTCGKVLDVGSGCGLFLELLKQTGIDCEGVDIDEQAIDEANAKGFVCHRIDAKIFLKNKQEVYDGLFCSNFLEHFQSDDVLEYLKLFGRVIQPGGLLILVGPNPRSYQMLTESFWLDPTHIRFYPNLLLARALESLGFLVLESGDDPDTRMQPRTFMKKVMVMILRRILPFLLEGDEIYLVAQKK